MCGEDYRWLGHFWGLWDVYVRDSWVLILPVRICCENALEESLFPNSNVFLLHEDDHLKFSQKLDNVLILKQPWCSHLLWDRQLCQGGWCRWTFPCLEAGAPSSKAPPPDMMMRVVTITTARRQLLPLQKLLHLLEEVDHRQGGVRTLLGLVFFLLLLIQRLTSWEGGLSTKRGSLLRSCVKV